MPYTTKSKDLPSYVSKLSPEKKSKWVAIFNKVFATDGEQTAFIVANSWLKKQSAAHEKSEAIARTSNIETIQFTIDETSEFITRTEDGQEYVSFKLADTVKDKFGVQLTEVVLDKWTAMINKGETVLGDIDHEEFEKLVNSGASESQVKKAIKSKFSIAKAIRAIKENGKLWVKAIIDKRYRKLIKESKGVSLEAIVRRDAEGNVLDGELLGFTFGVKKNPVISGTEVYA